MSVLASTASYVNTSSYANTASYVNTSSYANTASVAITASYFNFSIPQNIPPFATSSLSSSWATSSYTASYAQTSSYSYTASLALTASSLINAGGYITKYFNNVGCSWWVANPGGAFAYGNDLYVINYNRHTSKVNITKIDMRTNEVTYKIQSSVHFWNFYGRTFRSTADSQPHALFTSNDTLYDYNLTSGVLNRITGFGGSHYHNLPVKVLSWADPSHPDFITLYGSINASSYENVPYFKWYRHYYSGGSWNVQPATNTVIITSVNNNSSFVNFLNFSTNPYAHHDTIMWDFNFIKKRYYLLDNGTGYMHIFTHTTGDINTSWFDSSITYEKSIAIPMPHAEYWANIDNEEKLTIDYDIDTGEEKGIIIIRRGFHVINGSVTYVNWPEYGNW
jgi:hypothetical protein